MKWIPLLLLISACSTPAPMTSQAGLPAFNQNQICSNHSLNYLKERTKRPALKSDPKMRSKITMRVNKLHSGVRNCYKQESIRKKSKLRFNLCLVVGYSRQSEIQFFEFSTSQYNMSPEFQACLANLQSMKGLDGLTDVDFVQPFRLTPQ